VKYAAKIDVNQPAIVKALREAGATVVPTHAVGAGFPDLIAWFNGEVLMIEVKDGDKPPSARKLTPAQQRFHDAWPGTIHIVESIEQAIAVVTAQKRK
jgi:hypothetical protein